MIRRGLPAGRPRKCLELAREPFDQSVAGVLAAARVALKDAFVAQIRDVALGGGGRALRKDRPLPGGEIGFEAVEVAIEDHALAPDEALQAFMERCNSPIGDKH
ncbi:MAG: hypothetical protein JWO72_241 [Caulobacteraceae bacterium]|jgi:hypothetical protein|nr:hypothetical protein [Caulobacteraceae bacterium]